MGTASDAEKGAAWFSVSTAITGSRLCETVVRLLACARITHPSQNVNELKMQAIRELGAEVRLYGRDFDEAREMGRKRSPS